MAGVFVRSCVLMGVFLVTKFPVQIFGGMASLVEDDAKVRGRQVQERSRL